MVSQEEKVIELSKGKIVLLMLGAIAFVVAGIWMVTLDAEAIENLNRYNDPTLVYGIGAAAIVFFGLMGVLGLKKLFDRSPGIILNQDGLTDNSSGFSVGFIPWSDVSGIGQYETHKQKFISILLRDPEKYVNSGNFLRRKANQATLKMAGTPITISANSLKTSYEDLLSAFEEYFEKSR